LEQGGIKREGYIRIDKKKIDGLHERLKGLLSGGDESSKIIGRVMLRGSMVYSLRLELEIQVNEMIEFIMGVLPYQKNDLLLLPEDQFFMTIDRARVAYERQNKVKNG
jgi:hypothetical protein